MKIYYLLSILLLNALNCAAQQTVEKKGKLYNNITEKYNVLADSPEVKHGLYQALINKNTALASGKYNHGKKTGLWHFYDAKGKVTQHYNYDTRTLTYEAPEDTSSAIRYILDKHFTAKDTIVKPVKPGGIYYGYLPYLKHFVLPDNLYIGVVERFNAVIELLISPGGRLAEYKIRVVPDARDMWSVYNYNKVATMNMDILSEEDKQFIPATLNGEPVSMSVFITCRINNRGKLEYK